MTIKTKRSAKPLSSGSKLSYFVNHASVEEKKKIYNKVMSGATKMQNDVIEQAKRMA